jgi:hypothetical protein
MASCTPPWGRRSISELSSLLAPLDDAVEGDVFHDLELSPLSLRLLGLGVLLLSVA